MLIVDLVFHSHELNEVVEAILGDSSDSSSSELSDDDTDVLLLHTLFPPKEVTYKTRVCLDELGNTSVSDCQLFCTEG